MWTVAMAYGSRSFPVLLPPWSATWRGSASRDQMRPVKDNGKGPGGVKQDRIQQTAAAATRYTHSTA